MQFNGDIDPFNKYYEEGFSIFRKMTTSNAELSIYRLLKKLDHPNVVKIYYVGENYVDIEKVDTNYRQKMNIEKMLLTIKKLKDFLQSNGIMYIDWKYDNFGSVNDEYKLFDFDASGVINLHTMNWEIKPPEYFTYAKCLKTGITKPIDIDNYVYNNFYNDLVKFY